MELCGNIEKTFMKTPIIIITQGAPQRLHPADLEKHLKREENIGRFKHERSFAERRI